MLKYITIFNLKLPSKYSKNQSTDIYKEIKLHFIPLTSVPRSLLLCLPLSKPPQKNVVAKSFLQNLLSLLKLNRADSQNSTPPQQNTLLNLLNPIAQLFRINFHQKNILLSPDLT